MGQTSSRLGTPVIATPNSDALLVGAEEESSALYTLTTATVASGDAAASPPCVSGSPCLRTMHRPESSCRVVSRKWPTIDIDTPSSVQRAHGTVFTYFALPLKPRLADIDTFIVTWSGTTDGEPSSIRATFSLSALRWDGLVKHRGETYAQFVTRVGEHGGAGTASAASPDTSSSFNGRLLPKGRLLLRTRCTAEDHRTLVQHGDRMGTALGLSTHAIKNNAVASAAHTVVEGETAPPVYTSDNRVGVAQWTHGRREWGVVWERVDGASSIASSACSNSS